MPGVNNFCVDKVAPPREMRSFRVNLGRFVQEILAMRQVVTSYREKIKINCMVDDDAENIFYNISDAEY